MPIREYLCHKNHRTEKYFHNTERIPTHYPCGQCKGVGKITMSTTAPVLGAGGLPRSTWKGKLCSEGGEK